MHHDRASARQGLPIPALGRGEINYIQTVVLIRCLFGPDCQASGRPFVRGGVRAVSRGAIASNRPVAVTPLIRRRILGTDRDAAGENV
jgi:hypothetical protein